MEGLKNGVCRKCVEAVQAVFPGTSIKDAWAMLMGQTAYPFACVPKVMKQLRTLKRARKFGRLICNGCGRIFGKKTDPWDGFPLCPSCDKWFAETVKGAAPAMPLNTGGFTGGPAT